MSRGPGRWQRAILAALEAVEDTEYVAVADVGLALLGRSMTASEYRALNRAAWLLRDRGALHLAKARGEDYRGCGSLLLVAWTCANCSPAATSEHIPAVPCFWCKAPTVERNLRGYPDCGCDAAKRRAAREQAPPWQGSCFHCGRGPFPYRSSNRLTGYEGGLSVCRECLTGRTDALALAASIGSPP